MKIIFSIFFLILIIFINNIKAIWLPSQGMTWNYVLGNDIDVNSETANVVDIDIRKTEAINKLHKKGIKVICYFSVGTLESFRDDYPQFLAVKGLVKNRYDDWPDERWLDFRVEGIKPLLKNRMKSAVSKNCDAIEVDNLDGYQMDEVKSWSKPLTKKDTIVFAKWLSTTAHGLGLSIGLKNVAGLIDELTSYYDFAINEECIKYNECSLYKNFLRTGKAVFGVTYNGLSANKSKLCKNLNGLGISMIVKAGKKLEQAGTIFKGEKYCGSDFNSAINKCFTIPLGYPCCTKTKEVTYTNGYGKWGTENGDWCGLKQASKTNNNNNNNNNSNSNSNNKNRGGSTSNNNNNKSNNGSKSNGGSSSNTNSCFSKSLGYPCCTSKNPRIYFSDSKGNWSYENGKWCGASSPSKNKCFATALGYPCCSPYAKERFRDKNGRWGIEYGAWCGLSNYTTTTKRRTTTTTKRKTTTTTTKKRTTTTTTRKRTTNKIVRTVIKVITTRRK
jgi:hypothetical protein